MLLNTVNFDNGVYFILPGQFKMKLSPTLKFRQYPLLPFLFHCYRDPKSQYSIKSEKYKKIRQYIAMSYL